MTFRTVAVLAIASYASLAQPAPKRQPDVRYEPSSPEIVRRMLELGGVKKGDILYDLGCGDGRIVIAAAKEFGSPRRRHRHRSAAHRRGRSEREGGRGHEARQVPRRRPV